MQLVFAAVTGQYRGAFDRMYGTIASAAMGAIRDAQKEIIAKGRANIASAGYPIRWQNGFNASVTPKSGNSIDAAVHAFHRFGYATIFETGAVISGKPLLWLPLPTIPDHIGSQPMTPRNFVSTIGPLFTMKVPGRLPLLGAYMQGAPGSKVTIAKLRRGQALAKLGVRGGRSARGRLGVVATPVFVGLTSVTIKRHWNLTGVYEQARVNLAANFSRRAAELSR